MTLPEEGMLIAARCRVLLAAVPVAFAALLGGCEGDVVVTKPVGADSDTAFAVEALSPADGDFNVAEDMLVTVTFNRDINPDTLTVANFTVLDGATRHPIRGSISYDAATRTAAFVPEQLLEYGRHYIGLLLRNITATDGTRLPARVEWEFMVRTLPLTDALHTSPAAGATGVALTSGVRVDFPQRLDPASVTAGVLAVRDGGGNAVAGTLRYLPMPENLTESMYFQPSAPLAPNTQYTATLSGAIVTESGTPIGPDLIWSFTTASARTATLLVGDALDDEMEGVATGPGNTVFTITNIEQFDADDNLALAATVTKSDNAGNIIWQKALDAPDVYATSIAVDAAGNVVLSGITFSDAGGLDVAVAKLSGTNGATLWLQRTGTPLDDEAADVAVGPNGNIYVAVQTTGTFDGQTSAGNVDAAVLAFSTTGADLWHTQFGSSLDDVAMAIGVNAAGTTVFVSGSTRGELNQQANAGGYDIFLTRLASADGAIVGHTLAGTSADDLAHDLAVSAQGVYVNGSAINPNDAFASTGIVIAFDPTGATVAWQSNFKLGDSTELRGIAADGSGGVYAAGWYDNTDGSPDMPMAAVVFKLDATNGGAFVWNAYIYARADANANHMFMPHAVSSGVALDGTGNIFVSGTVHDGGLVDGIANHGRGDGFLVKLSPAGVPR